MMPQRIQLSRRKGFNLQAVSMALNGLPAVKVDRATKWGNPWTKEIARKHNLCECNVCLAARFQQALSDEGREIIRRELAGKNVACWCPLDRDCHGAVLLEIANAPAPRVGEEI